MRSGLPARREPGQAAPMLPSARRLAHPLAEFPVVLVRPRYPENVGAVARAMRVTGFENLVLVAPHPLATPTHEQARKMAVGSTDLLDRARVIASLDDAVGEADLWVATSARRGMSGVVSPRELGPRMLREAADGKRVALVFGGERTGLRKAEVEACTLACRIPMVGNEPSLNLSQAVMVMLYEILVTALRGDAPLRRGA